MKENLLTVNDVCDELGIGKTTAYKLIKDKEIHSGTELFHLSRIQPDFPSGGL